ncbi:MAG: hypothetical protein GX657_05860, partial [Chloroflexi bacterium]|nr:hypothetical protein [Chloroflexota bacterium]
MDTSAQISVLAAYVRGLADFEVLHMEPSYDHMGATLTDALLQSGLRYETVVLPRVREILAHPEAATTSGFLCLLESSGAKTLLRWKSDAKPQCVLAVTCMLCEQGIETEDGLR